MGLAIQKFKTLPYPLTIILLAGLFIVLGRIGLLYSSTHYGVSLIWPPSGIAIAAFLLFGNKSWPGITLGALIVNYSGGIPLPGAAIISVGSTLEAFVGAYILLRFFRFQPSLRRVYDVVCFVLVACLLATTIGATFGTIALRVSGVLSSNYAQVWGIWWAGDLMGVLIVAPLLLTWANIETLKLKWIQITELLVLLGILSLISVLVFVTQFATAGFYPLAYLTFPFLMWAAFRFGIRTVALSNLLVWTIAAWGTTQHIGPFTQANVQESLVFVCSYIGTISITGLLLAAAIGERQRSEHSLKESETLLQAVLENLPFEVWVRDTNDVCVMQNPASVALWGSIIGKGLDGLGLDEATLSTWQAHNQRTLSGVVQRGESEVMVHGERRYFYSIAAPFRESDKTIRGILGVNIDVTERKQVDLALRQSEERFSQAFRANPAGLNISTLDSGILIDVNPGFLEFSGFTREEVIGHTPEELNMVVGHFGRERMAAFLVKHGKTPLGEGDIRVKSGEIRHVHYSAEIMDIGGVPHVLGIFTDITDQKRAEIALRDSEARFRTIFEGANTGIIVVNAEGYCTSTNPAISHMLGYTEAEFRQLRFRDFTHPDDVDKNLDLFQQLQKGELSQYEMDKRYLHKQGGIVWVHLSVSALVDAATNQIASVSLIEDITERKRAEQALRESEARFRAIFEGANMGIAVFEPSGTAVSVNPALQRILGYSEDELVGIRFRKFTYPDDKESTVELFQQLQRGEIDHYQIDKRYIHKDGGIVWAQLSVSALGHSNGQGVMAVALIDDITEWKLADAALRESEARFRAIFEGANIGMAVVDGGGGLVSINPAFIQMLGYDEHELLGRPFRDFTHSEDVGQNLELFQQLMTDQIDHYQYEKRYIRKDGDIVWVRMNVSSFPNRDERLAVSLIEDVTQARQAEIALRQSEAHNAALLDSMPDLMFLLDKNGIFLDYRSPSHEDLFAPPELFMGKRVYDVLPEELTTPLRISINNAFENGETQFFEYDLAAGNGDPQTFESRIVAFDRDKVLIISRDVTERKRAEVAIQELNTDLERRVDERTAELAAANERLTELDRLKSKFIADVSHELRTPLAVLNTRVYLLEKGLPEKRAEYLTGLRGQIERLTQFVNTILDLSRLELGKGKIEFEPINLNEVVDQVIVALEPRAEASGLRLNVSYAKRLPPIEGEFNQLAQVATNLIANAINYTANGHIDVSTGIEGRHIYLRVQDTGMGIAPDDIPHLFERFYRGERAGQTKIAGSGLGLSIVKEIVDLHNGDIQVESQVGKGTTFTVTLPIGSRQETFGFVQ